MMNHALPFNLNKHAIPTACFTPVFPGVQTPWQFYQRSLFQCNFGPFLFY